MLWTLRMLGMTAKITCACVGVGMLLMGVASVLAMKRDAPSLKTFSLAAAVLVGLLSWSFVTQVSTDIRNDCILAETYLRLDHLEDSMHNVKHDELINGIMMRLDHINTDMAHMKEHAEDKVEEARKQMEFKEKDAKYVDSKLRDLMSVAEDAISTLDSQIRSIEGNITELEGIREEDLTSEQQMSKTQLKAKIRAYKYRQKVLTPRKEAITDVIKRIEGHIDGTLTSKDYVEILNELEKSINDRELLEVLQVERDDMPYVKASANRLQKGDYDRIMVGNYKEKARNRTTTQARQRKKYEKYMAGIYKEHDNRLSNREQYLHSLNEWLESMPEHCMQDLEQMWPSTVLGWGAIALSVLSSYTALTSTVLSVKKDF